jgi:hypothetical protein
MGQWILTGKTGTEPEIIRKIQPAEAAMPAFQSKGEIFVERPLPWHNHCLYILAATERTSIEAMKDRFEKANRTWRQNRN